MGYGAFNIPGVFTRIIDASQYQIEAVPMVLGMVGLATKGAFNTPTDVATPGEFFNLFGPPNTNIQSYYAADAFFARGNKIVFTRIGHVGYAKARYTPTQTGAGTSPYLEGLTHGTWAHDLDVYVVDGSVGGATIKISIFYLGALVEVYDNLANTTDGAAIIAAINGVSAYVTCVAGIAGGVIDADQNGPLSGGNDGVAGLAAADITGTIVGNVRTGLELYANQREYPVDLLICPDGNAFSAVGAKLLTLADQRGDCFALPDMPYGQTPAAARAFVNANFSSLSMAAPYAIPTFGAAYYPWIKTWDAKNSAYVWTPPSGHVAGAFAFNDSVAWPWFACMGPKRGGLIKALDVQTALSDLDIEAIYANGNVNAIIKTAQGIYINGKKTCYNGTTARRYVEVRRALLALRYLATKRLRTIQFDPNDDYTYRALEEAMKPTVQFLLRERAFRDLQFQCTTRINKASTKRANEIHAKFYCKPSIAIETIIIDLVLTSEGLAFSEAA